MISLLLLAPLILTSAVSVSGAGPRKMEAPISKVYAPIGFDTNDVVQFVVEGEFPNTCYSLGPATVRVSYERNAILFYVEAYESDGQCMQVKTPFMKVLDVGILPAGVYRIYPFKRLSKPVGHIKVTKAKSKQVDNFTYAPVEGAFIHNDALGYRRLVTLIGTFPNSCMKLSKRQLRVYRTHPEIIEILPVVLKAQAANCREGSFPFLKTIEIPDEFPSGKYLFHIRTMNGSSVNKIDRIEMDLDE